MCSNYNELSEIHAAAAGRFLDDPEIDSLKDLDAFAAQLAALENTDPDAALAALLACSPAGVDLTRFERAFNLTPERAAALARILAPYGYVVRTVGLRDCLHLKSACCPLPDGRLLVNPHWAELRDLRGFDIVEIADGEPFAADVLVVGRTVVSMAAHPRTAALIGALGFDSRTLDLDEFAKAEGGVTCMSLVFLARGGAGR